MKVFAAISTWKRGLESRIDVISRHGSLNERSAEITRNRVSYLERYRQGECVQGWAELEALGEQVGTEPIFSDAWAVAQETMRRVGYNLDLLIPRLQELGYEFGYAWVQPWELSWARSNPPTAYTPSTSCEADTRCL